MLVIGWAVFQFSGRNNKGLIYDNGQEKRIGGQVNNLNQGTWIWYHRNGEIQLSGRFDKGERTGIWKSYDTLGNLIQESTYDRNKLHGLFTRYSSNGQIREQFLYQNDTITQTLLE